MKNYLRNIVSNIASYIEVFLSGIILIGVAFASLGVFHKLLKFFRASFNPESFHEFLGYALALIVAVEFIKMLSRHTPGSTIEVLLFALARKLIVNEHISAFELLTGVLAIALLFWIKYYFSDGFGGVKNKMEGEGVILSAATPVAEARRITGLDLPEGLAQTVGGLITFFASKAQRKIDEGEVYWLDQVKVRISRFRDGVIERVELLKDDPKKND